MVEIHRDHFSSEDNSINYLKLNMNTAYLDSYPWKIEDLMFYVPEKIKNRLVINFTGLNKMTTVIVPPKYQKNLDQEFLNSLVGLSSMVNQNIGLPETNNLVIRTAKAVSSYPHTNNHSLHIFSEPMILASVIGSQDQKLLLRTEGKRSLQINSLSEIPELLPYDKYYLIHDDNESLQKKAVHGAFLITDEVSELVIRTNSLHARNITSKEFPHIKFTSSEPDYLFEIDPHTLSGLVQNGSLSAHSPRINMEGYCLTSQIAKNIFNETQNFSAEILEKYKTINKLFGEKAVMEFRLYPAMDTLPDYNRLQILDVNTKFT